MKTAGSIFLHDLKRLASSPVALIVILCIILLPSAYVGYSTTALWNPVSHTDGLKVVVVNKDEGIPLSEINVQGVNTEVLAQKLGDATDLNVGNFMIDAMREDSRLDWQFADELQAENGLASGEYFAEFVLPQTFTKNFLEVLNGSHERLPVEYWMNGKVNPAIVNSGDVTTGVVDSVVSRIFSTLASEALTNLVQEVAADYISGTEGANSAVKIGLDGASNDLKMVSSSINHGTEVIEQWASIITSSKEGLDALKETIPKLREAVDDGMKVLSNARTSAHEVASVYSSTLSQSGNDLAGVLADIASKVKKATSVISETQGGMTSALEKATKALDESDRLVAALRKLDPKSDTLSSLEEENETLRDEVTELEELNAAVSDAAGNANEVAKTLAGDIKKTTESIKERNDTFNEDTLPKIDTSLDSIALIMGTLNGLLRNLDAQIDQAKAMLDQLDTVFQRTKEPLEKVNASLTETRDNLIAARSDLAATMNSRSVREYSKISSLGAKNYSSLISSPVNIEKKQVFPLDSYGAGIAPFYISFALWVGCIILMILFKFEIDPKHLSKVFQGARTWQGYVGHLLLLYLLALLQGILVAICSVAFGLQVAGPVSLSVACLVAVFCFMSVIYALTIMFKQVGIALALILAIVQIPSLSGMYLIQLMPDFFQTLYSWLPLSHSIDAIQETIGGYYDGRYLQCLAWMFVCGLVLLAFAALARPRILKLNMLCNRSLNTADLFVLDASEQCSELDKEPDAYTKVNLDRSIDSRVGAYLDTESSENIDNDTDEDSRSSSIMRQIAPIVVIAFALCLGAASALLKLDINGKLTALMTFVGAVSVFYMVLLAFEFSRDRLNFQRIGTLSITPKSPSFEPQAFSVPRDLSTSQLDNNNIGFMEVHWNNEDNNDATSEGNNDATSEDNNVETIEDTNDSNSMADDFKNQDADA